MKREKEKGIERIVIQKDLETEMLTKEKYEKKSKRYKFGIIKERYLEI